MMQCGCTPRKTSGDKRVCACVHGHLRQTGHHQTNEYGWLLHMFLWAGDRSPISLTGIFSGLRIIRSSYFLQLDTTGATKICKSKPRGRDVLHLT